MKDTISATKDTSPKRSMTYTLECGHTAQSYGKYNDTELEQFMQTFPNHLVVCTKCNKDQRVTKVTR